MNFKAGNAFNASASVFEALSDVDTKFSKFVDKECDVINGEVKKWFKKLAVCRSALFSSVEALMYPRRKKRRLTTKGSQMPMRKLSRQVRLCYVGLSSMP